MIIECLTGSIEVASALEHALALPCSARDPADVPAIAGRAVLLARSDGALQQALERRRQRLGTSSADLVVIGEGGLSVGSDDPCASTRSLVAWLAEQHALRAVDELGGPLPLPLPDPTRLDARPSADDALWPDRLATHARWLSDPTTGRRLDLAEVDLYGLELPGADLRRSRWRGVNLELAGFEGADLRDSEWAEVRLVTASLEHADLRGASLRGVDLQDGLLNDADLRGSVWQGGSLRGVEAIGADLTDAVLDRVDLTDADLTNARGLSPSTSPDPVEPS